MDTSNDGSIFDRKKLRTLSLSEIVELLNTFEERDFEKKMIKQFLFFNKMIDEEIKTNGFIDKEKLGEILDKQVEYFKEISKGR